MADAPALNAPPSPAYHRPIRRTTDNATPPSHVRPRGRGVLSRAAPLALAAGFFCAIAPTLRWAQLHDDVENLNVATALEVRRGGPWLVPDLQGVPRLAKPPLTAWITAAAVRPSTVAALSSRDGEARAAAYDRLAFEARWPSLLAMCLMVAAVYELGRVLGAGDGAGDGARTGDADAVAFIAACACGTSFLFLRCCRLATTDCLLALWVTVGNLMLARALLRRQYWLGCLGAGAALGLALMAKGPVALLQTVLPFTLFLLLCGRGLANGRTRLRLAPVLVGALVMLAVGTWWYAWVAIRHEGMFSYWLAEVTRVDADSVAPKPWYQHFVSLVLFAPWLVWLAAGAWLGADDLWRRRATGRALSLLLLAVPLVVMSLAKDRFPRYLTPLAPAGALLAAFGVVETWRRRGEAGAKALLALHWLGLAVIVVGLPLAAASGRVESMLAADGGPWFTPATAVALSVAGVLVLLAGLLLQRRHALAMVVATVVLVLGGQVAYARGRSRSPTAQSDLRPVADVIWQRWPDAELYAPRPPGRNAINVHGNDLSIHLNRPLRWAQHPQEVSPSGRPQVWVTSRGKRAPEMPTPAGWELVAKIAGSAETRYVFVREPARQ